MKLKDLNYKNLILLALVFSFLIHGGLYLGLGWKLLNSDINISQETKPAVEVEFIELPKQKSQQAQFKKMQIIEQDKKSLNNEIDEKAKYLSLHNQKVVRETRAADTGKFSNQAGKSEQTVEAEQQEAKKQMAKNKQESKKHPGGIASIESLKPQFNWEEVNEDKTKNNRAASKEKSRSNDYIKNTDIGVQTALSSREFVYYSYYDRIRQRLREYWEPSIKTRFEKMMRQGRRIASEGDKVTRLRIFLNANGDLVKVQLLEESGVIDLDQTAVEAFKAAEPFPNPPKGMVDSDGLIKIEWSFVVQA